MTNPADIDIESTAKPADNLDEPPSKDATTAAGEPLEDISDIAGDTATSDTDGDNAEPVVCRRGLRVRLPLHRRALLASLVMLASLAALTGWLGWRAYQSHQLTEQRSQFAQAARQGALDLTTIDWQHADADVARILNDAAGTFYDDFSQRSQPFIDVLKKTQAKSEGTITASGLESASPTEAQALVALSVKISNGDAPEQNPRAWRMRISVQKIGHDVKVTKVEFVT